MHLFIFGKNFPRVCGCTFRIDNAKQDDLPFLKVMIDLRVKELIKKKPSNITTCLYKKTMTPYVRKTKHLIKYSITVIIHKDGIPRKVPQALFDKVQRERKKNERATARHKAEEDYLKGLSHKKCETAPSLLKGGNT